MVRAAGRAAIWALLLLVLVRGLGDIFAVGSSPRHAELSQERRGGSVRAFAVAFARAYLSGGARIRHSAVELWSGSSRDGGGVSLVAATVAGEKRLPGDRWLVTVACELAGRLGTRYLAVPVRSDGRGSLAAFGEPAVVAGPGAPSIEREELSPLEGPSARSIERLVERFLGRYLAGDPGGELRYLVAPGARLRAAGGLDLIEVERIGQAGERTRQRLVVAAELGARDRATGVSYPLAYRLEVMRRDRWYVAGVQGAVQ